jgi:hypothetical protein
LQLEPGLEPEHELEVLVLESKDRTEGSNVSTSLGLVQSSRRDFWTGIGQVQISTGLGLTGTGTVHSDGISPMPLGVSHTESY